MSDLNPDGLVSLKDAVNALGGHLFKEWTDDELGASYRPEPSGARRRKKAYDAAPAAAAAKAEEAANERRQNAKRARRASKGVGPRFVESPVRLEAMRRRRELKEAGEAAKLASLSGWDPSWPNPSTKKYREEFERWRRLIRAIQEFQRRMAAGVATAIMFDEATGEEHKVTSGLWLVKYYPPELFELSRGSMTLHRDGRVLSGPIFLLEDEIGALLSGRAARPDAPPAGPAERPQPADEQEPSPDTREPAPKEPEMETAAGAAEADTGPSVTVIGPPVPPEVEAMGEYVSGGPSDDGTGEIAAGEREPSDIEDSKADGSGVGPNDEALRDRIEMVFDYAAVLRGQHPGRSSRAIASRMVKYEGDNKYAGYSEHSIRKIIRGKYGAALNLGFSGLDNWILSSGHSGAPKVST